MDCISVENLTMEYVIRQRKGFFTFQTSQKITALADVSFTIKQGEIVALLGDNGAGKTTLLKAIGGILRPSSGKICTYGEVYTLRGANPGLLQSMTPRQNVRLLARSYGVGKDDVDRFESEIEKFCDLGDAFDRKYSTLSSGMAGRVGFGFTTSLNPDILLMDETLGVGDKNFRKKAEEKSKAFMQRGETILLSTHSLNLAKDMCSRGLVLDKGELVFDGDIDQAVDYYLGR